MNADDIRHEDAGTGVAPARDRAGALRTVMLGLALAALAAWGTAAGTLEPRAADGARAVLGATR